MRLTVSLTSAAPPPTRTCTPAGGASAPFGSRRSRTRARASSRFGPKYVVTVKAVKSPLVVHASAPALKRSGGPPGLA